MRTDQLGGAIIPLYAHTPALSDLNGKWHLLEHHQRAVADLAAQNASAFGAGEFGWWAGILHDAGKASEEFQRYLRLCHEQPDRKPLTVDHKGAGFLRALDVCEPLALLIQAHHGGLIDATSLLEKSKEYHTRDHQLSQILLRYDELALNPASQSLPDASRLDGASPTALEFWLRMLFSALIDADHLDTERHRNPETAELRGGFPSIPDLWRKFKTKQSEFMAGLHQNAAESEVNRIRAEVYEACLAAAERPPGFYRLTVPTGGGKTRSGFAFALKHASNHGLRRVIVAVPFLTITDQTARIIHAIFPDERIVLEHHSAAGQPNDDEAGSQDERESWRRLAAQDWDAPIIITTMVQLFESLLGRKTSVCRKLHRIAKSVIILDEAQTIPPTLRAPIFDVLHELVTHYGVSIVLCTATQPALDTLPDGVEPIEIVPEPARLFRALERVEYVWPKHGDAPWSWERAADEMQAAEQSLAIVNTVADAQKHLIETISDLDDRGVGFRSLTEQIDTTTSTGKLIFHVFGALAEFERDLIRERTQAGLAAARARGRKGGRPKKLADPKKLALAKQLYADKANDIDTICETLGISRATLYRYLKSEPPEDT